MKSVKYITVSVLFLLSFTIKSYSQYASIEKDYVVREKNFNSPIVSICFDVDDVMLNRWFYNGKIYVGFLDTNSPYYNQNLLTPFLNYRLKITTCFNSNCDSYVVSTFNTPLGNVIENTSENSYNMFNTTVNSSEIDNIHHFIIEMINLVNCAEQPLNSCENSYLLNEVTYIPGGGNYDIQGNNPETYQDCFLPPNSAYGCSLTDNFEGTIEGDDLKINLKNIDASTILSGLNSAKIDKILFFVDGVNGQTVETRSFEFYNKSTNPQPDYNDWEIVLHDFSGYNEYFIDARVWLEGGTLKYCHNSEELPITNRKTICDPLSLQNYKKHGPNVDSLKFSFVDLITNVNDFEQDLDIAFQMSMADVESIVATIDHVEFKLLYTEHDVAKEKTIVKTQSQLQNFENLTITFGRIDFSNFTGVLKTTVHKLNNAIEYCDDRNITFDIQPEPDLNIPPNSCDPNASNASNLNQTLYGGTVGVGGIFTANKFPIVITKINSGTNSTGIYGEAIVPLPFQNKQVLMTLSGVKFNIKSEMIAGQADGVSGNFSLNLSNLPLNIGGDICIPPPPPAGYTANGINSITGVNKYGFNPTTGVHSVTGTPYDPGGFDVNGNHKDTGLPYNEEGCTRDGVHHITGEKCDPYGGTPEELSAFVDSVMNNINNKLIIIIDSLILQKQNSKPDCSSFRGSLSGSQLTDNFTVCNGNALLIEGMSEKFDKTPIILPSHIALRDQSITQYETTHINLYNCDITVSKINKAIDDLNNLKLDLTELKIFIEEELNEVKQAEFDVIKKEPAFSNWLKLKIGEFIDQQNSGGNLNIKSDYFPFSPSEKYNAVANRDVNSLKEFNQEEILKEISWLYNNGEEIINNVPRGFYSHALVKKMEDTPPPSIPNVLPLPFVIERPNIIYTVYIEDFTIKPTSSYIDVTAIFKDKTDGTTLAFGGTHIPLLAGGVNTDSSKIFLKNDVSIKLINTVKLNLLKGQNETYLKWNCSGIQEFGLKGSIEFCSNYIIPLNNDLVTVPGDSIYKLNFTTKCTDWLDFTLKAVGQPFYIKGLKNFPIEVDTLAMDFSKLLSISANVPIGYENNFYDGSTKKFDPLWKGVSLHELRIHLPKNLFGGDSTTHTAIGVDDAIFDATGFSGVLFKENVVNIDTGAVAKWAFSVDGISLLFLHNNIAGGGLRGKIGVPFLQRPLDYDGILTAGNQFKLQIKVDSTNKAPVFFGNVILEKNSSIDVNLNFNNGDASVVANLTGSIEIAADTGKLSKLIIPRITFENFMVASYEPYFNAGKWGIKGLDENTTYKPNFSAFGITIDSIFPHKGASNNEIKFGIAFKADIIDSLLSASGVIDIVGELYHDSNDRQRWKHKGVELSRLCVNATVKKAFTLDACVEFFDTNDSYGKGFRGAGKVTFGSIEAATGIQAVCQFGTSNLGKKYFFVDVMFVAANIAQIGPITLTGLGGGVSKGMYPQFQEGTFPQVNFDPEAYLEEPLGTTMSGVVYAPDSTWGWEFKLLTKFRLANEKMLSGFGEFIVRLNNDGALEEIELRATAVMFSDLALPSNELASAILPSKIDSLSSGNAAKPEDIGKPTDNISAGAVVKGYVSVKVNLKRGEFHGRLAAYMNGPGIAGAGPDGALVMAEAYFSSKKWYIYIGQPTLGQRCGLHITAFQAIESKIETYLTAGTEVPGFPGLPKTVAHLSKEVNINESMRKSGLGFAFGASFDISINLDFKAASASLNAGLGFDVMLKKYNDVGCLNGPSPIGANGWYAMGQMWAYINGKLEVLGISILEAGAAAVLQAQFPNPTWARGAVEVYANTILGKAKYTANFQLGSPCDFVSADSSNLLGLDLIKSTNTETNTMVDQFFRPQAIFALPLNKELNNVQMSDGTFDFTFELDLDSTKIFYGNGNGVIDAKLEYNQYNLSNVVIIPSHTLSANDSIIAKFKVKIYKDEIYFGSQSKTLKLFIGPRALRIPIENVEYTYPVDGMYNFYKEENRQRTGFIKLVSGQGYLFNNHSAYKYKAKFTKSGGSSFYTDTIKYDYATRLITFDMIPSNFDNLGFYKLEIVAIENNDSKLEEYNSNGFTSGTESNNRSLGSGSGSSSNEQILYTLYFRVSEYNTFGSKMEDNNQLLRDDNIVSSNRWVNGEFNFQKYSIVIDEKLDNVDMQLASFGFDIPELTQAPLNNVLNTFILNLKASMNQELSYNTGLMKPNTYLPLYKRPLTSGKYVSEDEYKLRTENNNTIVQNFGCSVGYYLNSNKVPAHENLQDMLDDYLENYSNNHEVSLYFGADLYKMFQIVYEQQSDLWDFVLSKHMLQIKYRLPNGDENSPIDDKEFKTTTESEYLLLPGESKN